MKYKELIGRMTLEEKASLLSGANFWNTKAIERLGVPSMMITDGPHGLRKQGGKADHLGLNKSLPATCFPTASALACSWDEALLETVGGLLGEEAAANDVSALCGPGLNIKRDPLCGRNFEYFSEDPYLSGKLAAAMVRGIQAKGVAACPKHYAVNSQETRRMVIDEVVDERALREIYLEGFRRVVQEGGAQMVMTAYNRVNGAFANENTHLMRDILYGEWGFDGVVVTDWGGENDRVQGLIAGNQLEMPSCAGQTDREVVAAVRAGEISEALVDERVDALLRLVFATRPAMGKGKPYTDEAHHLAARGAACQCMVLLKNEGNALPLAPNRRVAVLGDFAGGSRFQGTGSSLINPTRVESALEALGEEKLEIVGYAPGFKRYGGKSGAKLKKAVQLARQADTVLLFLGLPENGEGECNDRVHMRLPQNQLDLLEALRGVAKQLVVVVSGGSPVEMPWAGQADAILYAGLGGQAVGGAVADVLVGRHNPGGKLTESWPLCREDCPTAPFFPGLQMSAEHRESIFVGYRYYDAAKVPVLWPFGYGLSYTTFAYSGLAFDGSAVSFTLKNTGAVAGAEIAQVYVGKGCGDVFRPEKELKGFAKVFLQPGEERRVQVALDDRAFQYYHTGKNAWVEEGGAYQISVGASCRDIRLACGTERAGNGTPLPFAAQALSTYFSADVQRVGAEEFEALLGRKLPPSQWDTEAPLGYNDTLGQGQYKKGFAHFLYNVIRFARRLCLIAGQRVAANNVMFAMSMPYRHLARMTGGIIDMPMLDGILVMANGRFWKGLGVTWRAWRAKRKAGL